MFNEETLAKTKSWIDKLAGKSKWVIVRPEDVSDLEREKAAATGMWPVMSQKAAERGRKQIVYPA